MKRLLLLFSLMLVAAHQLVAQTDEQQMRATISRAASGMRSMQCDFVQTKHLKMLNQRMVSRGKMYYQQPQRLRWEYTSPYTYTLVLNRDKVLLSNQRRRDVIDVNQNKMFKEIARLMLSSVVGQSLDDKGYETRLAAVDGQWVATLQPQRKDMRQMFRKIVVYFSTQGIAQRVEMVEKNGDQTEIDLKNVKTNETISADLFTIR